MRAVLTVLWTRFCHTGPISLCVDLFVFVFRVFLLSLHKVVWEGYFGYCMFFVCPVKLFSAVGGPIDAKFGMRHEPDANQVLRDFWGATPRDGDFAPFRGPEFRKKIANSGKTIVRNVSSLVVYKTSSKSPVECRWSKGATPWDGEVIAQNVRAPPPFAVN